MPSTRVQLPPPPVADLKRETKPAMPEAALSDDRASASYNSAVEAWGERGWAAVERVCQWFVDNGAVVPFACN
jgi:hypothetical protein